MLKYAFLGIIQGLTEFLPVSSSAHLVIFQKILGLSGEELLITVVMHMGTVLSLIIFFFKDILKAARDIKLLLFVGIVTIITGAVGLAGKDFFESLFSSSKMVALGLLVTGCVLILTRKFSSEKKHKATNPDAVVLGLAQSVAIIPGISRSGMTIATLLFRGLDRQASFKLSFLAAIPAILGAYLLELKDIQQLPSTDIKSLFCGFLCSLIVGLFSLYLLRLAINKTKLHYFAYYCFCAALLTIIFIK